MVMDALHTRHPASNAATLSAQLLQKCAWPHGTNEDTLDIATLLLLLLLLVVVVQMCVEAAADVDYADAQVAA